MKRRTNEDLRQAYRENLDADLISLGLTPPDPVAGAPRLLGVKLKGLVVNKFPDMPLLDNNPEPKNGRRAAWRLSFRRG